MPMRIVCPGCQTTLGIPETQAHQTFRCPKCQGLIPPATPAAAAPPPPPAPVPPPAPPVVEQSVSTTPLPVPVLTLNDLPEPELVPVDRPRRGTTPVRKSVAKPAAISGALVLTLVIGGSVFLLFSCIGLGILVPFLFMSKTAVVNTPRTEAARKNPDRRVNGDDGPFRDKKELEKEAPPVFLTLPPIPPPLPIRADAVPERTEVILPEAVSNVTVGGGGRFLLLHFRTLRKLGVFDVNEGKVVEYLALNEENVRVAAGMNKLALFYPGQGTLERYDLLTRKREQQANLTVDGEVLSFCTGAGSAGPLLLSTNKTFRLIGLDTLKSWELPRPEKGRNEFHAKYYWGGGGPGRVFGATNAGDGRPSGICALVIERQRLRLHYEHDGCSFVIPGADGKNLFPCCFNIRLANLAASPDGDGMPNSRGNVSTMYLPAHHGPFYMHLNIDSDQKGPSVGVTIHLLGSRQALTRLGGIGVVPWGKHDALVGLGYPGSVHLMPRANLLVVIPAGRDRLLLHPVNLDEALGKSGIPFLFVTSAPPAQYQPGKQLVYQVEAKAKGGGVTYHLEAGPEGMKVTPAGRLQWTPPVGFREAEVSVIVRVQANEGRQILHSFVLTNAEGVK